MGMNKNADVLCGPPSPSEALTVGEMIERNWTITAYCPRCRVRLHVDLRALVQTVGPDYVLWGRTPRCRVWVQWDLDRRCPARVSFHAQSSIKGSAVEMKGGRWIDEAAQLRSQVRAFRGR